MGCEVIDYKDFFKFFCNVADVEFGKFKVPKNEDVNEVAWEFKKYLRVYPRGIPESQLYGLYLSFLDEKYSTEDNKPLREKEE